MNKNIGKLARFGLAVGIVRLLNHRREGRVRRLFHRLRRRRSFTARTTRQLSMLARRSSKRLGHQVRSLPLIGNRRGRSSPVRRGLQNLPLVAGLSLPALSALSVQDLSLRNLPWTSNRRESVVARQARRMRMASMASMARNHGWLTLLGLGAALGLAGLFVFGRQVRARNGAPAMLAEPDENQRARYRPASGSPAAETQMAGRTEAGRRQEPAVGQQDWSRFCYDFSQANRGQPVNVEVQDAGGNARALAHEAPLLGVDLGLEGVQIMLGEDIDYRMEHDIPDPAGLQPIADEDGAEMGLVIHARDGSTTTVRLAKRSS
jgi:hypothetical protein